MTASLPRVDDHVSRRGVSRTRVFAGSAVNGNSEGGFGVSRAGDVDDSARKVATRTGNIGPR
jgi:hypothetical protein